MISLVASLATTEAHSSLPAESELIILDYGYLAAESDIFVDVCNSGELQKWSKGCFNRKISGYEWRVFEQTSNEGLVFANAVGPLRVTEEMTKMYSNILDKKHDGFTQSTSQFFQNPFSTLNWYTLQLEKCTSACYEDADCHASWAYIKMYTGQNPSTFYPELEVAVNENPDQKKTWFACHLLNENYSTRLKDVVIDVAGQKLWTTDTGLGITNDWTREQIRDPKISTSENVSTEIYLLASHYWVKPTTGVVVRCEKDILRDLLTEPDLCL